MIILTLLATHSFHLQIEILLSALQQLRSQVHLAMVHQVVSLLYPILMGAVETSLNQEVTAAEELLVATVEVVVVRQETGVEVLIMAALVKVFLWAVEVLM